MNGRLLLDTNIIIALFAQDDAVRAKIEQAAEVFVPAVALGELYYGARKSAHVAANLVRVEEFASAAAVLDCDASTAKEYGRIKDELRTKGRPIPENDIWIAATAIQHQLTLVSRDEHFGEIDGLSVEKW